MWLPFYGEIKISFISLLTCNLSYCFFVVQGLIQLMRSEGVELWDLPIPPAEKHKVSKRHKSIRVDDLDDWSDYV